MGEDVLAAIVYSLPDLICDAYGGRDDLSERLRDHAADEAG